GGGVFRSTREGTPARGLDGRTGGATILPLTSSCCREGTPSGGCHGLGVPSRRDNSFPRAGVPRFPGQKGKVPLASLPLDRLPRENGRNRSPAGFSTDARSAAVLARPAGKTNHRPRDQEGLT